MKIIEDINLVEDGSPITVRRTWKERFLSWPWHPLITTKVVIPKIPARGGYWIGQDTVVMHPQIARKFRLEQGDLDREVVRVMQGGGTVDPPGRFGTR